VLWVSFSTCRTEQCLTVPLEGEGGVTNQRIRWISCCLVVVKAALVSRIAMIDSRCLGLVAA
jgi:hypothetical protein